MAPNRIRIGLCSDQHLFSHEPKIWHKRTIFFFFSELKALLSYSVPSVVTAEYKDFNVVFVVSIFLIHLINYIEKRGNAVVRVGSIGSVHFNVLRLLMTSERTMVRNEDRVYYKYITCSFTCKTTARSVWFPL